MTFDIFDFDAHLTKSFRNNPYVASLEMLQGATYVPVDSRLAITGNLIRRQLNLEINAAQLFRISI